VDVTSNSGKVAQPPKKKKRKEEFDKNGRRIPTEKQKELKEKKEKKAIRIKTQSNSQTNKTNNNTVNAVNKSRPQSAGPRRLVIDTHSTGKRGQRGNKEVVHVSSHKFVMGDMIRAELANELPYSPSLSPGGKALKEVDVDVREELGSKERLVVPRPASAGIQRPGSAKTRPIWGANKPTTTQVRPTSAGFVRPTSARHVRPSSAVLPRATQQQAPGAHVKVIPRPKSAMRRGIHQSEEELNRAQKDWERPQSPTTRRSVTWEARDEEAHVVKSSTEAGGVPKWNILLPETPPPTEKEKEQANREKARGRKSLSSLSMLSRTKSGVVKLSKGGRTLQELIEKTSLKVNQATIIRASDEFSKVCKGIDKRVDMNQWDVVMRRLGVNNAILRHKVFTAFDVDLSNSVDYDEFVSGLTALWQGAVANKYAGLWRKLCYVSGKIEKKRLNLMDMQNMLEASEIASERGELLGYLEHIMTSLDSDHDRGITYDEFQLGVLRDKETAAIFDKIMESEAFHMSLNTYVTPMHINGKLPESKLLKR